VITRKEKKNVVDDAAEKELSTIYFICLLLISTCPNKRMAGIKTLT
jgi:hypothetical protein